MCVFCQFAEVIVEVQVIDNENVMKSSHSRNTILLFP